MRQQTGSLLKPPSHLEHGAFSVFSNPRFVRKLQEKTNKQPAAASAETDARLAVPAGRAGGSSLSRETGPIRAQEITNAGRPGGGDTGHVSEGGQAHETIIGNKGAAVL